MSWPADGRWMTPEQFKAHVAALDFSNWKPIGIVIHNTATPNLKRWHEFSRAHWVKGLSSYYQGLGWSGGPHLFIDDGADGIGLFNPLNKRGVHSPSFNAQWLGFEHVGDYAKEDDDAGPGLKVKNNGIAAMAIVCAKLGIDPTTHIKLHKEDPRTDHDCPGKDMADDKPKIIQAILEYMGSGGEHKSDWDHVAEPPVQPPMQPAQPVVHPVKIVFNAADGLNLRAGAGMGFARLASLAAGTEVEWLNDAMNGATVWSHVTVPSQKGIEGWVAARYLKDKAPAIPPAVEPPKPTGEVVFEATGKMSTFGGPHDTGVKPDEGLAIFETIEEAERAGRADFFMSAAEAGASGLARRLRPEQHYLACRWDYHATPRSFLQRATAEVSANGRTVQAVPMDWGPNSATGRVADLSPGLAEALGLETDQTCTVVVRKS